jgi:hypothetical protein
MSAKGRVASETADPVQLPGHEIKTAVAEFLPMAPYNHIIRQSQPRALRRLLALDEAGRLVHSPYLYSTPDARGEGVRPRSDS